MLAGRGALSGLGLLRFDVDERLSWTAGDVAGLGVGFEHVGMTAEALGPLLGCLSLREDLGRARRGEAVTRAVLDGRVRIALYAEVGTPGGGVVAVAMPRRTRGPGRPSPREIPEPYAFGQDPGVSAGPLTSRRYLRAVILAERRERLRIARMIHDDLQQLLTASALWIDHLLDEDADPRQVGEGVRGLLREAAELAHSIPTVLAPPSPGTTLADALDGLASQFERRFGLEVDVRWVGLPRPLPETTGLVLHEAVRELLFNVQKHAGVSAATVGVAFESDGVRVVVEDRGVGLGPTSEALVEGFGLAQIRNRLRLVEGELSMGTDVGGGTRASVWVPTDTSALSAGVSGEGAPRGSLDIP